MSEPTKGLIIPGAVPELPPKPTDRAGRRRAEQLAQKTADAMVTKARLPHPAQWTTTRVDLPDGEWTAVHACTCCGRVIQAVRDPDAEDGAVQFLPPETRCPGRDISQHVERFRQRLRVALGLDDAPTEPLRLVPNLAD